jgi:histidyl-tRNA synthetase
MDATVKIRNLDILNERLKQYNVPTHRSFVSESFSNLDWLKTHLSKRNTVDAETQRLLCMTAFNLSKQYTDTPGE